MGKMAVNLTSLAVSISVSRSKAFYGNSCRGSLTLESRALGEKNSGLADCKHRVSK